MVTSVRVQQNQYIAQESVLWKIKKDDKLVMKRRCNDCAESVADWFQVTDTNVGV